jgi:hypothetical protein
MDSLEILLGEYRFRGRARRVRCFAHTLNLTAKATLRQFEKKGKKKQRTDNDNEIPDFDELPLLEPILHADNEDSDVDDNDLPELEELESETIEDEEEEERAARDEEEIVNVFETLTDEEQERWKAEVKPIRSALYKVSC